MTKRLTMPIQFVSGVGPHVAKKLERVGVRTVADALFLFPRKYQDFTQQKWIRDLVEGETASVVGTVCDIDESSASGRHVVYVLIKQPDQSYLRAVWFEQPFIRRSFTLGRLVQFRGKVRRFGGRYQMVHPSVVTIDADQEGVSASGLLPVYPLTKGIGQEQMRRIIASVVDEFAELVEESLPDSLRTELRLLEIQAAIHQIHHPRSQEEVDAARRRFVFQELFILQLALAMRRHQVRWNSTGAAMPMTEKVRSRILARFPFELSYSQRRAIDEIAADMASPHPMNRLVHGDVGSGKTVVAIATMLNAVANGYQATLMAPTEILARQHFATLQRFLKNSRVRIGMCSGSMKTAERRRLVEQVAAGEIDILVGTHALVNQEFQFPKLGLVVIDEQHKFGVRQRAQLRNQGFDPHYLVMTATPIPRTISMTVFGDLDVSTLQLPESRRRVVYTYLANEQKREKWWDFFRRKLNQGRQGFVVAPLVQSDEASAVESVDSLFESLTNGPLAEYRLAMIHGRQTADEKIATMEAFAAGEIQVLVATGVIEVGIDVPNATVMTIESAERFGLSQLHQLRGRVGRGQHPGYVCAFASSQDPAEIDRLNAFESCDDGFRLAQIDLELRGPGNLFGTQQTGFPPLMIADLIRDEELLLTARQQAERLIEQDPELRAPGLERLRHLVGARYGQALELSDVA